MSRPIARMGCEQPSPVVAVGFAIALNPRSNGELVGVIGDFLLCWSELMLLPAT